MKIPVDEIIAKINKVLEESGEPTVEVASDVIKAIPANQLPPYVAEIEEKLFEKMLVNFEKLHGSTATPEIIEAIQFIARAEAVRLHVYKKLTFGKLEEYLENSVSDD